MKNCALAFALLLPMAAGRAQTPLAQHPRISGDTAGAGCSARLAAVEINAWFIAMSIGDTAAIRRLARPALIVFSAGRNGLPEPTYRADSVAPLVRYVADRHRQVDHWSLLEVRFGGNRGQTLGFTPITRRTSRDPRATQGLWLGKAQYECGRGVSVMNLAPWPPEIPPYRPDGARSPNEH